MEALFEETFAKMNPFLLAGVIIFTITVLVKSADLLVDAAVGLSERWRVPKVTIGATVVSLGTTMPEAAFSVLAAIQGNPGLALGNAVGSIVCDTGLILGIASLIGSLRLNRAIVNRQGWIQLGAGLALVISAFPFSSPAAAFLDGGRLPRWVGFLFLIALVAYIYLSIRWARQDSDDWRPDESESDPGDTTAVIVFKLTGALGLVLISANALIPGVAGAAAAVTPGGLLAGPQFFKILFPAMVFILLVFRVGVIFSGKAMKRSFGIVLLTAYAFATLASYIG